MRMSSEPSLQGIHITSFFDRAAVTPWPLFFSLTTLLTQEERYNMLMYGYGWAPGDVAIFGTLTPILGVN